VVSVASEDEDLERLSGVCRFLSRALVSLIVTSGVAGSIAFLVALRVLPGIQGPGLCVLLTLVMGPLLAVLGGLARMASLLWGGPVAAGILACSLPMPLVAPVALGYAIVVTRRRLAEAGVAASHCFIFRVRS